MENQEWIKPGAEVLLRAGYGWNTMYRPGVIERLTATQIVMADGRKFRLRDQREIGREYGDTLVAADDARALSMIAEKARKDIEWSVLDHAEKFRKFPSADTMNALKYAISLWEPEA